MSDCLQGCIPGLEEEERIKGAYLPILTACENKKGVLDVDTVKGCSLGLERYPNGGCYGECYAFKVAKMYGLDFTKSVSRKITPSKLPQILATVEAHRANWYRIGTFGDPCHDWDNTCDVCEALRFTGKKAVIITKHWKPLTDVQLMRLQYVKAIINTSVSGMDTDGEIDYRVAQINRIKKAGIRSVCRVVTCKFGNSEWSKRCLENQKYLLSLFPVIDNPLRCGNDNEHVINGDIVVEKRPESVGGGKTVSLHSDDVYLGKCNGCFDQCGYC